MLIEAVRCITDGLKDATFGVNAKLAAQIRDAGDTQPPTILSIVNSTESDDPANESTPIDLPALVVKIGGPGDTRDAVDGVFTEIMELPIEIVLLGGTIDSAMAEQDAYYTLDAVVASLRELFRNKDARALRRRNNVEIMKVTRITYGPLEEAAGQAVIAGAVVIGVRLKLLDP